MNNMKKWRFLRIEQGELIFLDHEGNERYTQFIGTVFKSDYTYLRAFYVNNESDVETGYYYSYSHLESDGLTTEILSVEEATELLSKNIDNMLKCTSLEK